MKTFITMMIIGLNCFANKFNSFPEPKKFKSTRHFLEADLYLYQTQGISTDRSFNQMNLYSVGYDPKIDLKYYWREDKHNHYGFLGSYSSKLFYNIQTNPLIQINSPIIYSVGGLWKYRFNPDLLIESFLGFSSIKFLRKKSTNYYVLDTYDVVRMSVAGSYIFSQGRNSTLGVRTEIGLNGPFKSKKYSAEGSDLEGSLGMNIRGEVFSERVFSAQSLSIGLFLDYKRINSNLYTQEEFESGLALKIKNPL